MALNLKIITPDGIFFNGPVDSVNIKTTEGYITLLEWRTPLIANIAIAPMMYRVNGQAHYLNIAGGILITTLHEVRVISDTIQHVSGTSGQESQSEFKKRLGTEN